MYSEHAMTEESLIRWRKWFFDALGPRELPVVCRMQGICPPSFRTPDKVPFPMLKRYFLKKVESFYKDTETVIHYLRTGYPELEAKIDDLPQPCTVDDARKLDDSLELVDLVLAMLACPREDVHSCAEQMMEELPPFELPEEKEPAAETVHPAEKENQRLKRLLDSMKKSSAKKEERLLREIAKLRSQLDSALQSLKQERKQHKETESVLLKQLRQEQSIRKEAERKQSVHEATNHRLQEQIRRLESQHLHLAESNQTLQEQVRGLSCEIDRLTAFSPVKDRSASLLGADSSVAASEPQASAPSVPDQPNPPSVADAPAAVYQPVTFDRSRADRSGLTDYPETVRGVLQIPIRSRFGFLSTEQGMDLFVSEKIIYNIGAKDGDELEGVLIGEYAPGLPQYRYKILEKAKEPSNHRELLGIVEERSGWVGVRDLYDVDLFVPLHAYEVRNVSIGDVVTLLFDVSHPHNNRILTLHEHLSPEEAESSDRISRRKHGRSSASARQGESAHEPDPILQGMHVLICGAQSNMVSQYEQAIRARGGSVVVLEQQPASMEPYVSKADVIICNTHQMSHPFYWVLKEESARQNKPMRYPISGGVSSMLREVEEALSSL